MSVASAQTLQRLKPLEPFVERSTFEGMTFGLSSAGYDVRIAESFSLGPGCFKLASTQEKFFMPKNLIGIVHDKSTWARRGLAVQNTVIEPNWSGYLTLELTNHHNSDILTFKSGMPIAQIIFHLLDEDTSLPYDGKYQNQEAGPQSARLKG